MGHLLYAQRRHVASSVNATLAYLAALTVFDAWRPAHTALRRARPVLTFRRMDESTIAEMRARATAAKERIDAVEHGEIDEPEFDEVVTAAAMFANDAAKLAEDVDALTGEVERLTRERDAYKKAKAENDERFMLERDEARGQRDESVRQLRHYVALLRESAPDINEALTTVAPTNMAGESEHAWVIYGFLGVLAGFRQTESARTKERDALAADIADVCQLIGVPVSQGPRWLTTAVSAWGADRSSAGYIVGLKDSSLMAEREAVRTIKGESDLLSVKITTLEPLIDALCCADRQELPRSLAARVTAYIAALPTVVAPRPSSEIQRSVYDEIRLERSAQDAKWGGAQHDDEHTPSEWIGFIIEHAAKSIPRAYARRADLLERATEYSPMEPHEVVRKQMVRVAALALATIESFDRVTSAPSTSSLLSTPAVAS